MLWRVDGVYCYEQITDLGRRDLWHRTAQSKNCINNKRLTTIKTEFGNMKYGKFQQAEVYGSLYFQSNSKSAITVKKQDHPWYLQIGQRQGVWWIKTIGRRLIERWLDEDDGYEKLLHRLLTRDVSDFSPTAWPPQTEAKNMMVANTAGFKYAKIITAWNDRMFPFTSQSRSTPKMDSTFTQMCRNAAVV